MAVILNTNLELWLYFLSTNLSNWKNSNECPSTDHSSIFTFILPLFGCLYVCVTIFSLNHTRGRSGLGPYPNLSTTQDSQNNIKMIRLLFIWEY